MVNTMRRRILAAVAAAAVITGGTLAVTESPAEAAGCALIDINLRTPSGYSILHLCI
jgi:hypothetical protein